MRFLRSIFLPHDETCFYVFEAPSTLEVTTAAARAGIRADRIVEAISIEAGPLLKGSAMRPRFRIGVMQLTMEPLDEMIESARVMDRVGLDTIWLAEAYPWWRKHGMEARSSTVTSALIAQATERLTIGWGIISPFTRHPVQAAMDARVVQEAAGPDRR